MQRVEGKTPHQLRAEAEAQRDGLLETVEHAHEAICHALAGNFDDLPHAAGKTTAALMNATKAPT
jgi:hypothetical protein